MNYPNKNHAREPWRLSSFQIISIGFLSVMLIGTLLLMLPFATRDGQGASFMDALFTATSATCVTGLVVQDTATYWSGFGQAVLLILIQIGGMGVVTLSILITAAAKKRIGLMQRSTMQESISAPQVGGIVRLTRLILKTTIAVELLGALLMAGVFIRELGVGKGIWYALFHSISAFCNAGFDLFGFREKFSSLTAYPSQPVINLVIMALIVIGGIGFLTWEDIGKHKWRLKKYRMQSKVVLSVSALLIVAPAVYFFFCEFSNMPLEKRVWASLFQSVTVRTAGFNTVDLSKISQAGQMLMILLMLVGGSPGSTAGGMKTTTLAVLFSNAISVFKRKDETELFGREVPAAVNKNAAAILLMYLTLMLSGSMVISYVEEVPMMTAMFEAGSAVATVGLSLGLTPTLGTLSRVILIVLMYLGRVGGLTLIFAALSEKRIRTARYPQEKITVG